MSNESQKTSTSQTKLWLDILIFIAFLITMDPHSSGIAIHEWLSLAMVGTITVHLLLNWDWIVEISKRFLGNVSGQNRTNYILNWLLFFDGTMIMISGIMISEVALPALGIQLPAGFEWRRLHDISANIGLLLLGVHTALHWGWIVTAFSRYLVQPVGRLFSAKQTKDISL